MYEGFTFIFESMKNVIIILGLLKFCKDRLSKITVVSEMP
jgi:hypothetical protein